MKIFNATTAITVKSVWNKKKGLLYENIYVLFPPWHLNSKTYNKCYLEGLQSWNQMTQKIHKIVKSQMHWVMCLTHHSNVIFTTEMSQTHTIINTQQYLLLSWLVTNNSCLSQWSAKRKCNFAILWIRRRRLDWFLNCS